MPSIYKQHECQSWPKIKVLDELKKKQTNIHRYQVLYWYKEIPVSHSIASFLNINRQPKISKHWGQLIKWQSKTKIHTHKLKYIHGHGSYKYRLKPNCLGSNSASLFFS